MKITKMAAVVRALPLDQRAGAGLKALGDGEADHGAFEVVLSTPTRDREGEEVKAEEWEQPLPEHITFDVDHGMSVVTTVGSGVPTLQDGNLVVRGLYASTPLAQTTRALVAEGHIRTTSVAFSRKSVAVDGQTVTRRELLNGAFVAIPANPEAVVLAGKSLTGLLEGDDVRTELSLLAGPDGAQLRTEAAGKALKAAVTKAIAGSYEERQRAVGVAVDRLYEDDWSTWAWLVGTTDTEAVWRVHSRDETKAGDYRAGYTLDAAMTATLGDPVKVRVVEVVTELPADETTVTAKASAPSGETPSPTPSQEQQLATKAAAEAAAAAERAAAAIALAERSLHLLTT